jgi:hypothetical protein
VVGIAEKLALADALASCVSEDRRFRAVQFLEGLSGDELQYIAAFYGSLILNKHLEAVDTPGNPRAECDSGNTDECRHEMLVLLEFLCLCP